MDRACVKPLERKPPSATSCLDGALPGRELPLFVFLENAKFLAGGTAATDKKIV
ncbi:hypothetical protein [Methylomonas fluvii]|nr:hypothetical protein [Methylomonas fluvii]